MLSKIEQCLFCYFLYYALEKIKRETKNIINFSIKIGELKLTLDFYTIYHQHDNRGEMFRYQFSKRTFSLASRFGFQNPKTITAPHIEEATDTENKTLTARKFYENTLYVKDVPPSSIPLSNLKQLAKKAIHKSKMAYLYK